MRLPVEVNARFSLVACGFLGDICSEDLYARLISQSTGIPFTAHDFIKAGARSWHLERTFNVLEGFSRNADTLPGRCFEPIQSGPVVGRRFTHDEFNAMLDRYYELRNWTSEGIPTADVLKDHQLPEASKRLQEAGLI